MIIRADWYCSVHRQLDVPLYSPHSPILFFFFSPPTKKATKSKLATSLTTCKHKSLMNSETLSSTPVNFPTDTLSTLLELTGAMSIKSRPKHRRLVSLPDRLLDLPSPLPRAWLWPSGLAACTVLWLARTSHGDLSATSWLSPLISKGKAQESFLDVPAVVCLAKPLH